MFVVVGCVVLGLIEVWVYVRCCRLCCVRTYLSTCYFNSVCKLDIFNLISLENVTGLHLHVVQANVSEICSTR